MYNPLGESVTLQTKMVHNKNGITIINTNLHDPQPPIAITQAITNHQLIDFLQHFARWQQHIDPHICLQDMGAHISHLNPQHRQAKRKNVKQKENDIDPPIVPSSRLPGSGNGDPMPRRRARAASSPFNLFHRKPEETCMSPGLHFHAPHNNIAFRDHKYPHHHDNDAASTDLSNQ
jgi:hypothetical protein